MHLPINRIGEALKMGVSTLRDSDEPVRVSVFVDDTATPFLIDTIREAFVPQTTSAIVRVSRLSAGSTSVKSDTDISIVLTCGSADLQAAVQAIVVAGAPTVVVCESSVEVPFIQADTPMLGMIASTNKTHLLETLARWILDRTEKMTAFASNFAFMRVAASNRIITSCALTNLATGALVFIPGADYPVMTLAQIQMQLSLAETYGRGLKVERAYEAAAVALAGLALRGAARLVCRRTPHISFLVKALIGGAGTYAMGRALMAYYDQGMSVSDLLARARARTRRTSPLPVSESY